MQDNKKKRKCKHFKILYLECKDKCNSYNKNLNQYLFYILIHLDIWEKFSIRIRFWDGDKQKEQEFKRIRINYKLYKYKLLIL
jgi:hypothetical protein